MAPRHTTRQLPQAPSRFHRRLRLKKRLKRKHRARLSAMCTLWSTIPQRANTCPSKSIAAILPAKKTLSRRATIARRLIRGQNLLLDQSVSGTGSEGIVASAGGMGTNVSSALGASESTSLVVGADVTALGTAVLVAARRASQRRTAMSNSSTNATQPASTARE